MELTNRQLLRRAAETGFEAATIERVAWLADVLREVGRHPELREKLVLKGGTALNLFGDSPKRLSVDLDFNYIGSPERETMLQERPAIEAAVEAIGRSLGLRPQRSPDAHAGRKFYFAYPSLLGGLNRLEVDLNYLHRICLLPSERRRLWTPSGSDGPEVALASSTELAAGKLCALLDRTAARDLWDVSHLPELIRPWPPPFLRQIFVALAGALPRPLPAYDLDRALAVAETDVERLLHPMLTAGERPTPASLRARAEVVVAPLLALTREETEFSIRLEEGELLPELLVPDDSSLADRLRRHPVLQWKALNAAKRADAHRD